MGCSYTGLRTSLMSLELLVIFPVMAATEELSIASIIFQFGRCRQVHLKNPHMLCWSKFLWNSFKLITVLSACLMIYAKFNCRAEDKSNWNQEKRNKNCRKNKINELHIPVNLHKSKQEFWTDMVNVRNVLLPFVIECIGSSSFWTSHCRSFKLNIPSCPNHSRFTMLQSPPLTRERTAIVTAATVEPIKTHQNREILGGCERQSQIWWSRSGSGPASCKSPSLKRFNR